MSQHVSDIGNVHAPLESEGPTQEHGVDAPARNALHDAPALMEKSLDEARPPSSVPEHDVPEAVLERRNEETSETLAARDLASALARNDAPSASAAAARLEGRPLTPTLEALVLRAGTDGRKNPEVSDAPAPSLHAGTPEVSESLAAPRADSPEAPRPDTPAPSEGTAPFEETDPPASSDARAPDSVPGSPSPETPHASPTDDAPTTKVRPSTTTTVFSRGVSSSWRAAPHATTTTTTTTAVEDDDFPDEPSLAATTPRATTTTTRATTTTPRATTTTTATIEDALPPEDVLRELEVPEDMFRVLEDFRPGMLYPERLSLEEMQDLDARIASLLDGPLLQEDDEPEAAPVRMRLLATQAQLKISMESRTHAEALLADLDRLTADPARTPSEKLNALADMSLIWRHGREQTQALRRLESRDPQVIQDIARGLNSGTSVVGEDLDALEEALVNAAALLLEAAQNEKSAGGPKGSAAPDAPAGRDAVRNPDRTGESDASAAPDALRNPDAPEEPEKPGAPSVDTDAVVRPDADSLEESEASMRSEALGEPDATEEPEEPEEPCAAPAEDSLFSAESLRYLARLSLHGGERPEQVLEHVRNGVSWAFSAEHRKDLVNVMLDGLMQASHDLAAAEAAGRPTAAALSQAADWIDMAFQGAYPDFAAEALTLKKLAAPGHENEIEAQHACVLAGRQLMNLLMTDAAPASGRSRADALSRTLHQSASASARSFVLTPDLVAALTRKAGVPNFNFHLAHVALLQKRAAEYGMLAVSDAERARMTDAAAWCRELLLGDDAADYAAELDRDLADPDLGLRCEREIEEACARFAQGFAGMHDLARAGVTLESRAAMTGGLGTSGEEALYRTSPDYLARRALDRHIVNLTGLIRPEQRLTGDAMTLNGNAVDDAMRRSTDRLYTALFARVRPEHARRAMRERDEARQALLGDLHIFAARADIMNRLALSTGEGLRLRPRISEDTGTDLAMKKERSLLHFTWPHRRPARLRNSETVLRIADLHEQLSGLPEQDPERRNLENEIRRLLDTLSGVNPFTLAPSLRRRGQAVPLETVLEQMLPRARAVTFFEKKILVNGRTTTRARLTQDNIRRNRSRLDALQNDIDRSMKGIVAQFGKDNILRLQQTVAAALFKVFAESGERASAFTLARADTQNAVLQQLRTWGMPVHEGLSPMLIRLTLASLTRYDGTLKPEALRREAEETPLGFAGKDAAEAMKRSLRSRGRSLFSAWNETRRFINESLLPVERRRAEGVRALLREASLPGSGFTYDRTRGLVVDTGAVFMPFSAPGQPVTFVNLSHPLSVRMRLMKNNTMAVSNMGNGCYQVLLKGGFAASLGASMKLSLPVPGLTLSLGGNAGGRSEDGLALTFASQADCENFLISFMKPDSDIHLAPDPSPAWLSATQVRFVSGKTVSADAAAAGMYSLFGQALGAGLSVSGSVSLSVDAASGITRQLEQNASGETVTFSVQGKVHAASSLSFGLSHSSEVQGRKITVMAGSPVLNPKVSAEIAMEQRFRITTGPQGVAPSTCLETECSAASFRSVGIRDIGRRLLLPKNVRRLMADTPAFADDFTRLMHDLPESARIVVRRVIRPDVLDEVRRHFIAARTASDEKNGSAALKAAHDLLASFDSYTPVSISVRSSDKADISTNWSPGLAMFQYSRNNAFARAKAGPALEIPLPQQR